MCAAIAHMRFDFIEKVCEESVVRPKESKEHIRSTKIDRILTGKYTAIPCFVGIMAFLSILPDLWGDRSVSCQYPGHGYYSSGRVRGSDYDSG